MKEFLKKLIKDKKDEIEVTRKKMMDSQDVNEVRSLGETIDKFRSELDELEKKLAEAEKEDDMKEEEPAPVAEEGRSFNPLASYSFKKAEVRNSNVDSLSTMEYRTAFMNYVQKGEMSNLLKRADSENVSSDLGILLPNTIVNEVIKGVEKVYGQLYSRVKKTNLKGGVQYPVGSFGATLYWQGTAGTDKEHGVSEKQKAGTVNSYVQFTYHIGEIRIAQSLLQTVVSVDAFESEIVKALVEAYVKAMDEVIMNGDGLKQPEGILTEAKKASGRIPRANIIEFNADEIKDWTKWQSKLFAKIPLSMRSLRPEFVLNAGTYEAN
ncbi:MAG: phage major capsid protein, partial [Candidatus Enterosoma sp.]|nr:phage major capsid protein [Candidatus Enterosoma sp.]